MCRLFPSAEYKELKSKGGDEVAPMTGAPYGMQRGLVLSPLGIPCTRPPWGTIAAIDLDTGEIRWHHPFGAIPVGVFGLTTPAAWGRAELGRAFDDGQRPCVYRRGARRHFRALDINTGNVVWRHALPFPGVATPMSFQGLDGRQYIVIAAGGASCCNPLWRCVGRVRASAGLGGVGGCGDRFLFAGDLYESREPCGLSRYCCVRSRLLCPSRHVTYVPGMDPHSWLGRQDSNLGMADQNPLPYHLATPQCLPGCCAAGP